jgi:chromosome segregation ATPase
MSIKRYTVIFEEEHIGECETGKFVLYTDHLAVMKEKENEVAELRHIHGQHEEQIAALQAEVQEVDLLKRNILSQYKDVCFELGEAKTRIKELTEALEKIYWEISDRLWSHS